MARSARNVERWYRAIAISGPRSAIESAGDRCHSTTSISAADAISANGAVVCFAFPQISLKKGRPESIEMTALIRTRLTTQ